MCIDRVKAMNYKMIRFNSPNPQTEIAAIAASVEKLIGLSFFDKSLNLTTKKKQLQHSKKKSEISG